MSIFQTFLFSLMWGWRNAEELFIDMDLVGEMGEENYGKLISCPELIDD